MKIPDLSEETYDDLEMTVTCDEETRAKAPLKEKVRKEPPRDGGSPCNSSSSVITSEGC